MPAIKIAKKADLDAHLEAEGIEGGFHGLPPLLEDGLTWVRQDGAMVAVQVSTAQSGKPYYDPHDYGAIADGVLHPLGERYDTLEEAQDVYPFVTSLVTEDIDWAAIQHCINLTAVDTNPNPITAGGIVLLRPRAFAVGKELNFDNLRGSGMMGLGGGSGAAVPRVVWMRGAGSGNIIKSRSMHAGYFSGFHLHAQVGAYDGTMWDAGFNGADQIFLTIENISIGYPGHANAAACLLTSNCILSKFSNIRFASGNRQLYLRVNYQVANTYEDLTFNGGRLHQIEIDVGGTVENCRFIRTGHEPAGEDGECGDITMTNGSMISCRIEDPWFGDHIGVPLPGTGAAITVKGDDITISGYRNSGLATGSGSHVKVGSGSINGSLSGSFLGGNGIEFVGGASQGWDLGGARFAATPPDQPVVGALVGARNVPWLGGGVLATDKGHLFGRSGTLNGGDATTPGVAIGAVPALATFDNTYQGGVAYHDPSGDLLIWPRSTTPGSEVRIRARTTGSSALADRMEARGDGVILRTADNSVGFRVTDDGWQLRGGTVGMPTITGERFGIAALTGLLSQLDARGAIIDETTAGSAPATAADIADAVAAEAEDRADADTAEANARAAADKVLPKRTINADDALVLGDAGKIIVLDDDGPIVLTIPPHATVAFPVDTVIDVTVLNTGAGTIHPGAGVTIPNVVQPAGTADRTIDGQLTAVSMRQHAIDVWHLVGSLV